MQLKQFLEKTDKEFDEKFPIQGTDSSHPYFDRIKQFLLAKMQEAAEGVVPKGSIQIPAYANEAIERRDIDMMIYFWIHSLEDLRDQINKNINS